MKVVNATLKDEMKEVLKKSIGMMMYSFSVENSEYNRNSENHFENYLTSALNFVHLDFVIFNEITVVDDTKKHFFLIKRDQDVFLCFSVIPDCTEPDKIEGVMDIPVDEVVSDVKIVTDTYEFKKSNKVVTQIVSDIAIIIELETKKIVFQRTENWSDNLSVDIYEKNENNMFYLSLNQKPDKKGLSVESSRKIVSLSE